MNDSARRQSQKLASQAQGDAAQERVVEKTTLAEAIEHLEALWSELYGLTPYGCESPAMDAAREFLDRHR